MVTGTAVPAFSLFFLSVEGVAFMENQHSSSSKGYKAVTQAEEWDVSGEAQRAIYQKNSDK